MATYVRARLQRIADDMNAGLWKTAEARLLGKSYARIYAIRQQELGNCYECGQPRPVDLKLRCRMHQDMWNMSQHRVDPFSMREDIP